MNINKKYMGINQLLLSKKLGLFHAVSLDLFHQRLQRVDHPGTDIAAHKDPHHIVSHFQLALIQPYPCIE